MSQHLGILHPLPFSSTTKSHSFSLHFTTFGFSLRSHSSSTSCGCSHQTPSVPLQKEKEEPLSLHLQPISSETHFDRVLAHAHQLHDVVLVVWVANWCRKCIYFKPKLEKLAADYYPRLLFYSVDVNTVSHKLVERAGVTVSF
ncbi:hypothetical protein RJT34_24092 [Clitoria ternatea]|uniref:Thioredoxin domain-containing protein n=1 Tax=Clitoria ternatea TaxID=43366 RepID=A0AAN9FP04_CLITE